MKINIFKKKKKTSRKKRPARAADLIMVVSLVKFTDPRVLAGRTISCLLTSFTEHQLVSSYRFSTEETNGNDGFPH